MSPLNVSPQVPQAEVETWLVQREPDPLPLARPEQSPLLERNTNGMERDRGVPLLEHTPQFGNVQEEVEDEDKEVRDVQGPSLSLRCSFLSRC